MRLIGGIALIYFLMVGVHCQNSEMDTNPKEVSLMVQGSQILFEKQGIKCYPGKTSIFNVLSSAIANEKSEGKLYEIGVQSMDLGDGSGPQLTLVRIGDEYYPFNGTYFWEVKVDERLAPYSINAVSKGGGSGYSCQGDIQISRKQIENYPEN